MRHALRGLIAAALLAAFPAAAQEPAGTTPSGPTQLETSPTAQPTPITGSDGPMQITPGQMPVEPTTAPAGQATPDQPASIEPATADIAAAGSTLCPTDVLGTAVFVEETPDGLALEFTSNNGRAPQVRERVQALSEFHNGREQGGTTAGVAATAEVENTVNGARLRLTPADPGQRNLLRTQLESTAADMRAGACPMIASTSGSGGSLTTPLAPAGQPGVDQPGRLDQPNQPGVVDPATLDPLRDNEPIRPAGQTPLDPDGSDPGGSDPAGSNPGGTTPTPSTP